MGLVKKKKTSSGNNVVDNVVSALDFEDLAPPAPDTLPQIQNQGNQGNNGIFNGQFGEVALNEPALEELIEKEQENLKKKENSQTKSLEEIKTNLNSLNSLFKNINNSLYDEEYYSNLKMQISK